MFEGIKRFFGFEPKPKPREFDWDAVPKRSYSALTKTETAVPPDVEVVSSTTPLVTETIPVISAAKKPSKPAPKKGGGRKKGGAKCDTDTSDLTPAVIAATLISTDDSTSYASNDSWGGTSVGGGESFGGHGGSFGGGGSSGGWDSGSSYDSGSSSSSSDSGSSGGDGGGGGGGGGD